MKKKINFDDSKAQMSYICHNRGRFAKEKVLS